jgi:hypothetical protein
MRHLYGDEIFGWIEARDGGGRLLAVSRLLSLDGAGGLHHRPAPAAGH